MRVVSTLRPPHPRPIPRHTGARGARARFCLSICVSRCLRHLFVLLWLGSPVLLQGCGSTTPHPPDVTVPYTFVMPAGGIYSTFPAQIRLWSEEGATIYYRWQEGKERHYTAPIRVPEPHTGRHTLYYWARDAAGNTARPRREHYVLTSPALHVEIVALDRAVLGLTETAMLRWQSTAVEATYEIAVSASGWAPGRRIAAGQVVPGVVHDTPIPGAALRPGENRLWLRVQKGAGMTGATSHLLYLHATPAITRAWPASGVFGTPQTVQLFTERAAVIYYTTDGSEPTLNASRYTTPLRLEGATQLRYFSVDAYGNREAVRQDHYDITPQVPTITLRTIAGFDVEGEAQVPFTWRSDMAGLYDVTLRQHHTGRVVTVLQGKVARGKDVRSMIAQNFLTAGDWQVRLQVQPPQGQAGWLSFWLRVQYVDTFADTRYLDAEATTAIWDTEQRQVRLSRGPRLLSTYDTRGRSRHVLERGGYVFLANGRGGLHILDVSDPQALRRVGILYPHGKAAALAKYQQYVYVAAGTSGLTILDVGQPAEPRLVSIVSLRGGASDILIVPPYAYVGTQQGVLYILDLTTPLQPRLLGQIDVGGQVVDMAVADGVAYLACLKQGVVMVDVRTPQQPRLLQRWVTQEAATGIALHDQRAYVAAGALEVLDVRQPETPVREAIRRVSGAYGVHLLPPYVLVATGTDGVQALPLHGAQVASRSRTTHYAARLAVMGTLALVADTRGGLHLFDMAQPEQPRLLAALPDVGIIVDVVVDGRFAYLADDRHGSGLVVVDLSTPAAPRVVGQYHTEATSAVVVWQHLAIVGDEAGVLHMVDVQDYTRPRVLGSLSVPGSVQRVVLLPPYVLVAGDSAGLHVVEITPDHRLALRATVPIPGRALDIALVDQRAYIAAVSGGIQVVEVSTPLQPTLQTPYHHSDGKGDDIIRLLAHQQHFYAIDGTRGVQIVAASETGALQLRGTFAGLEGAPWAMAAEGPYLFVSTLLNSLYVVDVTTPSQPRVLSTAPYGGAGLAAVGRHVYIAVRGSRGVPGGLRLMETFTTVSADRLQHLRTLGIPFLPGETSETFLVNRAYTVNTPGFVQSTVLSRPDIPVLSALLQVEDFWGPTGRIDYELSNDGGVHWQPVEPGEWVQFTQPGSDVRWRATLLSTDLATTPLLDTVRLQYTTAASVRP